MLPPTFSQYFYCPLPRNRNNNNPIRKVCAAFLPTNNSFAERIIRVGILTKWQELRRIKNGIVIVPIVFEAARCRHLDVATSRRTVDVVMDYDELESITSRLTPPTA
jgi:hypothetical protein